MELKIMGLHVEVFLYGDGDDGDGYILHTDMEVRGAHPVRTVGQGKALVETSKVLTEFADEVRELAAKHHYRLDGLHIVRDDEQAASSCADNLAASLSDEDSNKVSKSERTDDETGNEVPSDR